MSKLRELRNCKMSTGFFKYRIGDAYRSMHFAAVNLRLQSHIIAKALLVAALTLDA